MWKPFSLLPAIISVAAVVDHRPQLPAQRGVHALERGGALQCQPFQRAQTRVLILISIAISYTFCSRVPRQYGQIDDLVAIFGGLDLQLGGFGFQPGYPVFSSTFSARSVSTLPLTASVTLPTARSPSSSCASSAPTR